MRSNTLLDYGLDAATPVNTPTLGSAFDVIAPCPVDLSKLAPAQVTVEALREQADRLCKQMGISQDDAVSLEAIAPDVLPRSPHEYTYAPTDRHYAVSMEGLFTAIGKGLKKLWEMICNFFRWVFRLDPKTPATSTQKKVEKTETKAKEQRKEQEKQARTPPAPTQVKSPAPVTATAAAAPKQQKHDDERAAWSRIQQELNDGDWYNMTPGAKPMTKDSIERLYNAVTNNLQHFTNPASRKVVETLQDTIAALRGTVEVFEGKNKEGFGNWAAFEAGVRYLDKHAMDAAAAINSAWMNTGSGLDFVINQTQATQTKESIFAALGGVTETQQTLLAAHKAILMNTPNDPYTRATDEFGQLFQFRARKCEYVTDAIANADLKKRAGELDARLKELSAEALRNSEEIQRASSGGLKAPDHMLLTRSRLERQQKLLNEVIAVVAQYIKFESEHLGIINFGTMMMELVMEIIAYKLVINECRLAYT